MQCPSFLTAQQAATYFNKSIGAPVCARYGHVYGKMGAPEKVVKNLSEHYVKFCNDFGVQRPERKDISLFNISIGEPSQPFLGVPPITAKPASCHACKFFVPEDVTAEELGWSTPLCKKRGHLMLGAELQKVARDCADGEVGQQTRTTIGVTLFPELMENFGVIDATAVGALLTRDPKDYESDKEVTDEDKIQGIVGWRRIDNPDPDFDLPDEDAVYLPIFAESIFSELEQEIIPLTGDKEHPEEYVDHYGGVYAVAVHLTKLQQTPAVWGEPGMGKTELFRHLAWMTGMPFRRFTITASSELDDLAGKPHFSPEQGTYFAYGRFVQAYQSVCWLCVDEPNLGPKDVWQFFRPLTDNSKQLVMDVNIGEILYPTNFTFMGFAMNPAWDLRNVGAELLADADTNRLMHIEVPMPDEYIEMAIIQKHLAHDGWQLDDDQAQMIRKVAEEIRGLIAEGPLSQISWGLRPQIKVARALKYFGPVAAYRQAVANTLDPTTREILLMAVKGNAR